ncbi:hypothetical protein FB451DRAFT_1523634, partial [Mycena latifolia]
LARAPFVAALLPISPLCVTSSAPSLFAVRQNPTTFHDVHRRLRLPPLRFAARRWLGLSAGSMQSPSSVLLRRPGDHHCVRSSPSTTCMHLAAASSRWHAAPTNYTRDLSGRHTERSWVPISSLVQVD